MYYKFDFNAIDNYRFVPEHWPFDETRWPIHRQLSNEVRKLKARAIIKIAWGQIK